MTVHKRKKATRYRGSQTHGGGAKKKRRGSGNRGGFGRSGTGKRCDSKKPIIWGDKYYFGKRGFKKKGIREEISPININYLEEKIECLVKQGFAKKSAETYEIDLDKIGYNKLLGAGNVTKKFNIKVKYASENAINKIKSAGGNVDLIVKPALKRESEEG
ncbi:MAG: 50S ribosomal protein L15 [Candidatus Woesearchaeota archaeon]|nr:50S ribosomal protein L15 [Candidatus Woesearchaeota archaeon]